MRGLQAGGPTLNSALQIAGLLDGVETPEFCSISSSLFSAVSTGHAAETRAAVCSIHVYDSYARSIAPAVGMMGCTAYVLCKSWLMTVFAQHAAARQPASC